MPSSSSHRRSFSALGRCCVVWMCLCRICAAAKWLPNGPILTFTLTDPSTADDATGLGLSQLKPSALFSVRSQPTPFPRAAPFLKRLITAFGCQYTGKSPGLFGATAEATAQLDTGAGWRLQIQPTHEFDQHRTHLLLQLARGAHYAFVRAAKQAHDRHLQLQEVTTSWLVPGSSSRLRCTPSLQWLSPSSYPTTSSTSSDAPQLRCLMEAVTGARTKAWLSLSSSRPASLSLQYAPDDHHLIRPTIDLSTGSVVYQWIASYGRSSTVQIGVDPTQAIDITWRDGAMTRNGSSIGGYWTVEARVPLTGDSRRVRVRVKRQFRL